MAGKKIIAPRDKLMGDQDLRERLRAFLTEFAKKVVREPASITEMFDEKVHFDVDRKIRLDDDQARRLSIICADIQGHLGPDKADLGDIRGIIATHGLALADAQQPKDKPEKDVLERLAREADELRDLIAPNRLVSLPDHVDKMVIGPVTILRREKLVGHLLLGPVSFLMPWDTYTVNGLPGDELSPQELCWHTPVLGMPGTTHAEARWRTDVVVGLLIAQCVDWHQFLILPAPFGHLTDEYRFGDRRYGPLRLAERHIEVIESQTFKEQCDLLFEPNDRSVGERLHQSLGWFSRSLQSADAAERFLFTFTAIEAALSPADDKAPVVATISRHIAVMQHDDAALRAAGAKRVGELYKVRSKLVHNGSRKVNASELREASDIALLMIRRILGIVPLDMPHACFCEALSHAAFGSPIEHALEVCAAA